MRSPKKTVDGFRFLPPGLAAWIRERIPDQEFQGPIPWTTLLKPPTDATLTWPEEPKNTKWHPPEMSPVIKLYLDEIRAAAKKNR